MPELFGVGGTICEKPDTCTTCLVGVPVHFHGVTCADPLNNRIIGTCASCAKKQALAQQWRRTLSDDQLMELDRLESVRYYAHMASIDSSLIEDYGPKYLANQVAAADAAVKAHERTLPPYPEELAE